MCFEPGKNELSFQAILTCAEPMLEDIFAGKEKLPDDLSHTNQARSEGKNGNSFENIIKIMGLFPHFTFFDQFERRKLERRDQTSIKKQQQHAFHKPTNLSLSMYDSMLWNPTALLSHRRHFVLGVLFNLDVEAQRAIRSFNPRPCTGGG